MGDKKKRKKSTMFGTCSKIYTTIVLVFSLVCVGLTYVLAFMGKEQIAETLSGDIVRVVISVFITYSIKSYKETKSEKELEHIINMDFRDENGNGIDDSLEEEMMQNGEDCM